MIFRKQNKDFIEVEHDKNDLESIIEASKLKSKLIVILTSLTIITTSLMVYMGCSVYKTTQKLDQIINVSRVEMSDNSRLNKLYNKLNQIDAYYKMFYVGDIDYDNLELIMGNALISAYGDEYGAYFDKEYALKQIEKNNSSLHGIGILVRAEENKQLYVIETYDGPAEKAGIYSGCIITKVNGEELDLSTNELYTDVMSKIKGEIGTTVNITFIDTNNVEHTIDIERAEVKTSSINCSILENNVGYILIREFAGNTDEEFREALKYLKDNGVDKVIYDVRGNSGGLLTSVCDMLDVLLPSGDTIYIVDAKDNVTETYSSDEEMIKFEKSIVLVNRHSASASELFSQSLKDFGIATIIGETTYGKGTVCSEYMLTDNDMVMISTYKYLTNSKYCIEDVGVEPDIEFVLEDEKEAISYKLPIEEDDVIAKALDVLY